MAQRKRCTACKVNRPLDEFYRQKAGRYGRAAQCKRCFKAYYAKRWLKHKAQLRPKLRAWKKANPDKVIALHLRRYGLTNTSYNTLLASQDNCCAVCHQPFGNARLDRPTIDHDHATTKVRGIVHNRCNLILGLAKESGPTLVGAAEYLQRHKT